MKKLIILLLLLVEGIISSEAQTPKMMICDTSRKGVPFSKDPHVIHFKVRFLMYYSISGYINKQDWTDLSKVTPMLKPELPWERDCIEGASIINKIRELFMFYARAYNNAPQQIGVAKSSDGVQWTRLFDQPFLANGKPGKWNSSESGHPRIFSNPKGDDYLFFQGNNDNGKTRFLSNVKIS